MMPIRTARLLLRNWDDRDRAAFHRLNSEERIMAFFPYRRTRAEADARLDELIADIDERGFGFGAVERVEDGAVIGFAGISPADPPDEVEVGWRFVPEAWGKGYATEAASGWLDRAFTQFAFGEVIAIAVKHNHASTAVMQRLGMTYDATADFRHPDVPATRTDLQPFVLWRLPAANWRARRSINPSGS